jgi:hypothetical protein
MKIKQLNKLTEALIARQQVLTESCKGLTNEQAYVVNRIYKEFTPLVEAVLTQDQINNIFKGIEQGATAGGNNRTMVGKGVDVAKEVNKIMDQVGTWLQDTAPVQFFDKKFEELKTKIKNGLGEDSKTLGYINALGQAAKDNPGTTAAVIGLLTVVAGLVGSPAAATLVAYTLRSGVSLVKGEKLSTAVGQGLKTAAITWLTGKAFELVKDAVIAVADNLADLVSITTNITPINDVVGNVNMNVNVDGQTYIDVSQMPMLQTDYTQLDGLKQAFYDAMPPGGNGEDAAAALQAFNAKLAELTTADYAQKVADAASGAGADSSGLAFTTYDTVRDGMNQVGDALQAVAQGAAAGISAMPNSTDATTPAEEPKGTTLDTDAGKVQSTPGNRQVNDIVQFGAKGDPSNARWTGEEGKEWEIIGGSMFDRFINDPSNDRMNNIQRDTSSKMHKLFIDKDNAKRLFALEGKRIARGQQRAVFEGIQYIYEEPSLLAKIQQGATKVLNKLAVKGGNLTNKVTADKLQQAWVKAGKPMDSDDIMDFLVKQGVDKNVAGSTFDSLSIPRTQPAQKTPAPDTTATTPATDTPATPDATAPATPDATTPATPDATATTTPAADTPAADTPAAPAAPTGSIFSDFNRLRTAWQQFSDSGENKLPIQVKGILGDILKTAFNTVESRRILNNKLIKLTEAKARIDHPEDLVFEEGADGAMRALNAIKHAAVDPKSNSVKWDGTPAIIFGRDEDGFIMTDKAGFGAKKYDGMARSAKMFRDMIYNRKPDEQGRLEYSTQIAKLYPMLEKLVPTKFRGFIQGDIMWMSKPEVHDGAIEIQPLKVKYTIDPSSDLGKKIKASNAGIVVHSYFTDRAEEEPRAMTPAEIEALKPSPGLVVLSPVMQVKSAPFEMSQSDIQVIENEIEKSRASINKLLDSFSVSALKISNLSDIFKSFLNYKAGIGEHGPSGKEFLEWLKDPSRSKLTTNKIQNVLDHISKNKAGFTAVFKIANMLVELKYRLKDQLDAHASQGAAVTASVREHPGHEGFVADTPHGKIKLVNRPVFMKKV